MSTSDKAATTGDARNGFSTGWQVKIGFPSPPFFVYEMTPVSAESKV